MKGLGLTLIAAGALALASAAQATVILHIKESPDQFPAEGYFVQIDLELIDVSGGGLEILGFDMLASSEITFVDAKNISTLDFLGVEQVETNAWWGVLWGSLGGPVPSGSFPAILHFSLAEPGTVDLAGLFATDGTQQHITSTVRVCDETPFGGGICTPEPGTAALLGAGLIGLALRRRL